MSVKKVMNHGCTVKDHGEETMATAI